MQPLYVLPLQPTAKTIEQEGPSKRGYRHHPKPDPNAPERPYSAYVLFSNHVRDQLKVQNLTFTSLSKLVGERWQSLTPEEKEAWKQRGAGPWEGYKAKVAQYQRTPQYQEYQRYSAEFKAAEAAKKPARRDSIPYRAPAASKASPGDSPGTPVSPNEQSQGAWPQPEPDRDTKATAKRLKREEDWSQVDKAKSPRARQACEPCRRRKTKCSAEFPTCQQCKDNREDCHYGYVKREATKGYEEIPSSYFSVWLTDLLTGKWTVSGKAPKCMRHYFRDAFRKLMMIPSRRSKTLFHRYLSMLCCSVPQLIRL